MAETGQAPEPGTDEALLVEGYAAVTTLRPVCELPPALTSWPAGLTVAGPVTAASMTSALVTAAAVRSALLRRHDVAGAAAGAVVSSRRGASGTCRAASCLPLRPMRPRRTGRQ